MWVRNYIEVAILDKWCDGWSVDRIVEMLLTTETYHLDLYWQNAIQEGWDMRPSLRRNVIDHLQSHDLCDPDGRATPTIPCDLMMQIIGLDRHLSPEQITLKLRTSGVLNGRFARMSADDALRSLLHSTNMHRLQAKAALWDAVYERQVRIDSSLDEIIEMGLKKDAQRRLALHDSFENVDLPFAKYFGVYGNRLLHGDADSGGRNVLYQLRSDPFFGFVAVVDEENEVYWREDSDGEVVMDGNMPPWGYASLNSDHNTRIPTVYPPAPTWPQR